MSVPAPPVVEPPAAGRAARALIDRHAGILSAVRGVLDHLDGVVVQVARWVHADERRRAAEELAHVDVSRLGETTDRNLRLAAVQAAGYLRADSLLGLDEATLSALPGVGDATARAVVAAVRELAEAATELRPLRIGVDRAGLPTPDGADAALALLFRVMRLRPLVEPHRQALSDYVRLVSQPLRDARPARGAVRMALSTPGRRRRARAAVDALVGLERWLAERGVEDALGIATRAIGEPDPGVFALVEDFERRSVEYYTALSSIVPDARTALAARGLLPSDLVERVSRQELDLSALTVPLREYQAFGARFALNQGRVVLGDEMGLGKTMQALAVMSHLVAQGENRFLVVCPASVLATWHREITAHSTLDAHRFHGDGRDAAAATWRQSGGVLLATYDGLEDLPPEAGVGLLVADEAHYVKNHRTRRARAVAGWAATVWRTLFLTGTPMDNRLDDFLALVQMLQPELVATLPTRLGVLGADAFRRAVAPVYLRRNQRDVLVELPELIATDDWVDLTPADEVAYRQAVRSGNLMAMRQAAWTAGPDGAPACAKLDRLLEVVEQARLDGRSVLVFTFFRAVADTVVAALRAAGAPVHGPLHGDVPVEDRQGLVDAWAQDAASVLVAQVTVGGTGLNLQAASVVVLCEPQLTPTLEAQAVARAHRMGQVRTVQVHRLLAEDTADERIVDLLARKRRDFDLFLRTSAMATATTEAVGVSQAELAREVVAAEQSRLGYGPVWDELAADEPADRPTR